jgi:DNA-directed RNA polymerase, mitochondrial
MLEQWSALTKDDKTIRYNLAESQEIDNWDYSLNKYWESTDYNQLEAPAEQDLIKDFIRQTTAVYESVLEHFATNPTKSSRGEVFKVVGLTADVLAGIVISQIIEDLVDTRALRSKIYDNGVDNAVSVAYRIGREVQQNLSFRAARETPEGHERFQYLNKYIKKWTNRERKRFIHRLEGEVKWPKSVCVQVGLNLLQVAAKFGVISITKKDRIDRKKQKYKTYNEIGLNPDIMMELIKKHEQYSFVRQIYRPMIVPPIPHSLELPGGSIHLDRRKPTVSGGSRPSQEHLDALNAMQMTEWSINVRVFEVMQVLFDRNERECNLPAQEFEEFIHTVEYPKDGTVQDKIAWKLDKEAKYGAWYKEVQKRAQMFMRLSLAKQAQKNGFFYHAYTCDFRGRAYTLTEMLSPQSGDFDRGLIQFATPTEVTPEGLYWLKVHTVNVMDGVDFGTGEASDKDSFDDRVAWVDSNIKYLRKISDDPYTNSLWMDNKTTKKNASFQRLAAINDLVQAIDTGFSSVPVQLDGSCNGSQHWSAIMRDPSIAELVNVAPTDKPGDLYQHVADEGYRLIKGSSNIWHQIFLEHWEGKIPRKVFKRATMCDAYGMTDSGIRDALRQEGHLDWVEGDRELLQAINELARVIREALNGALESSNDGKHFLQDQVGILGQMDRNARESAEIQQMSQGVKRSEVAYPRALKAAWVTPSGFLAINDYMAPVVKVMRSFFYLGKEKNGTVLATKVTTSHDNLASHREAAQAIPPNFIHSIDAAHMMLTINECLASGITKFSMIHDSFGCPCSDIPTMRKAINQKFYEIHQENLLERFQEDLSNIVLKRPLPGSAPLRGTLDINGVLGAEYLFG